MMAATSAEGDWTISWTISHNGCIDEPPYPEVASLRIPVAVGTGNSGGRFSPLCSAYMASQSIWLVTI